MSADSPTMSADSLYNVLKQCLQCQILTVLLEQTAWSALCFAPENLADLDGYTGVIPQKPACTKFVTQICDRSHDK